MTIMLLEWVVTSAFLILVVLALRAALGKRVSARLRYALWAVVLVRLLIPMQLFTSPLAGTRMFTETRTEQNIYKVTDEGLENGGPEDIQELGGQDGPSVTLSNFPQAPNPPIVPDAPEPPAAPDLSNPPGWLVNLGRTWLAGAAAVALVLLVSNLRFYWRLRRERIPLEGADCPLRVYAAVGLPSPCLFGLIRPAIYVTPEAAASPAMLRHVLAHEYTHYRQGDHIWSLLRCVALAAHWWNPLVWLAAVLSQRDAELACDEGALKRLGDGERAGYGSTLLALVTATPRPGDLLRCATTMAGDKKSLKERINRIACAPKRVVWAVVAAVLVTALACVCAFGQAAEEPIADPEPPETPSGSEEPWWNMDATRGELVYELREDRPNDVRIELPEYPGVVFHCTFGTVTAVTEEGEQTLFGGMPVWDVYVCDLTGDGRRELCSRVSFGSGMVDDRIRVYDYAEQTLYELENRGVYDYTLRLEEERLWAEEWVYNASGHQNGGTPRRAGPLILTEQGLDIRQDTPEYGGDVLTYAPDLNRNGVPETLEVVDIDDGAGQRLEVWEGDELLFSEEGYYAHAGYNALFLYTQGGEDYLLRYHPYMGQGWCDYSYTLFTLTRDGQEQMVRENSVEFDINFGTLMHESFDLEAIAAFMDEINDLLARSAQLMNTDGDLLDTFEENGRLYDNLWWLDIWEPVFVRDDGKSLLENLRDFQEAMDVRGNGDGGYATVLLRKSKFILDRNAPSVSIDDVPGLINDDPYTKIWSFTTVDMDGDGTNEVLLDACGVSGDMRGYLVLYQVDGKVYGVVLDVHVWAKYWFEDLKKDGTFERRDPTGTSWMCISRLGFSTAGYTVDDLAYVSSPDHGESFDYFEVNGKTATKAEFEAVLTAQDAKPDAVWHDFTEENIYDVFLRG